MILCIQDSPSCWLCMQRLSEKSASSNNDCTRFQNMMKDYFKTLHNISKCDVRLFQNVAQYPFWCL